MNLKNLSGLLSLLDFKGTRKITDGVFIKFLSGICKNMCEIYIKML